MKLTIMKKALLIAGAVILILILVAVFVLAYFGLVPGLSKLFVKQKDLGVDATTISVESLYSEMGFVNENLKLTEPTSSNLVYSGTSELNRDFTSEELSSILSSWHDNYTKVPFRNVQVLVSEDGTVEFSAIIVVDQAVELARMLGYTDEQIDTAKKYAKFVSNEIPVYAKGNGGAVNNDVNINASEMRAGNIQVPAEYVSDISSAIEDVIERRAVQIPGLHADNLSFDEGKMNFQGTIPAKVEVKK